MRPVGSVLLFLMIVIALAGPQTLAASAAERPVGAERWSESDVLTARPKPMPEISGLASLEPAHSTAVSRDRGGAPASPPRLAPPPDRAGFLADPRRLRSAWPVRGGGGGLAFKNRGSSGFDFSSSRVIPEAAVTTYPYSTTGILLFRSGGEDFLCSAAVISKRLIATAGHCIYDGEAGFSTDILFAPAFHDGEVPLGVWRGVEGFVPDEWLDSPEVPSDSDFGIIVMADSEGLAIGDVTGWLGYKVNALENNHVKMLGYPSNHDGSLWMHQVDSGDWFMFDDPPSAVYGSDMRQGSSGGPWVQNFGVKARGQKGGKNKALNRIVGLSSAVSSDKKIMLLLSSPLDATFKKLFNTACDQAPGNCAKRSKPSG